MYSDHTPTPPEIMSGRFNNQMILERWDAQFAVAQNQPLAAGVLEGIFERLCAT
jgi:hypothetical protein